MIIVGSVSATSATYWHLSHDHHIPLQKNKEEDEIPDALDSHEMMKLKKNIGRILLSATYLEHILTNCLLCGMK